MHLAISVTAGRVVKEVELLSHIKSAACNDPACRVTICKSYLTCVRCKDSTCKTLQINRSRLHDVPDDLFAYIGLERCSVFPFSGCTASVPLSMTAIEIAHSDDLEIRLSQLYCICSLINFIIKVKDNNRRRILLNLEMASLSLEHMKHRFSDINIYNLAVELRISDIDKHIAGLNIYILIIKFILRVISSYVKKIRPAFLNILYRNRRTDSFDHSVYIRMCIRIYGLDKILIRIISGKPDVTISKITTCMNFRIEVLIVNSPVRLAHDIINTRAEDGFRRFQEDRTCPGITEINILFIRLLARKLFSDNEKCRRIDIVYIDI